MWNVALENFSWNLKITRRGFWPQITRHYKMYGKEEIGDQDIKCAKEYFSKTKSFPWSQSIFKKERVRSKVFFASELSSTRHFTLQLDYIYNCNFRRHVTMPSTNKINIAYQSLLLVKYVEVIGSKHRNGWLIPKHINSPVSTYKRKIFKFWMGKKRESIQFHSRIKTFLRKEIGHHHVVWQDKWSKERRIVWNAGEKLIFVVREQKQCEGHFFGSPVLMHLQEYTFPQNRKWSVSER